jgi:TPR repeat protein
VSYSEAGLDDLDRGLDLLLSGGSAAEAAEAFQSAARHGIPEGYLQLARLERENGNEGAARDLIRQVEVLAEQGDAFANLSMHTFHFFGEGNGSPDEEQRKDAHYLRRAAELGHAVAQHMLAQRLFRGSEGVAQDRDAYEVWIMRAIEQGLPDAVVEHARNRMTLEQELEPWLLDRLRELVPQWGEAREVFEAATGGHAAPVES